MDSFEDEGRNDSEPHVMRADEVQDGGGGEHGQLEAGNHEPAINGNANEIILISASFSRGFSSVSHLREKNMAINVSQVERGGTEGDDNSRGGTSDPKSFLAMSDSVMPPFRVNAAFGPGAGKMLNMAMSTYISLMNCLTGEQGIKRLGPDQGPDSVSLPRSTPTPTGNPTRLAKPQKRKLHCT